MIENLKVNPISDQRHYRPNVGIALFNARGEVFMGRRLDLSSRHHAWQLPQGGIDQGEMAEHAAIRELEEETGIENQYIQKLDETKDWIYYDFPENMVKKNKDYNPDAKTNNGPEYWIGQKQKWFAFRFLGKDHHIEIDRYTPEFDQWRWANFARIPESVIPWKKSVYQYVVERFMSFSNPV